MVKTKCKILLESLSMPVPKIALQGGFLMRDATSEELKAFRDTFGNLEYRFKILNYEKTKTLEKTYELPQAESIHGLSRPPDVEREPTFRALQENERNLRTVLTALRLIKPGTLGYRISLFEPVEDIGHTAWIESFMPVDQQAWGEGEYRLDESDIETLQTFWAENKDRLFNLDQLGALQIAISRFEMSYHKNRYIDKFLDLMIAMEALYLTGNEQMEMGCRMSQRAALLLGLDRYSRMEIRGRIKDLYDIRSKLVHGADPDKAKRKSKYFKNNSEFELMSFLKSYVRNSIIKFLSFCEDSKSIDKKLAKLDDDALDRTK